MTQFIADVISSSGLFCSTRVLDLETERVCGLRVACVLTAADERTLCYCIISSSHSVASGPVKCVGNSLCREKTNTIPF